MPVKFVLTAALFLTLAACGIDAAKRAAQETGGNPDRGAADITHYGCGSCHTIPGIAGAHGLVGPPLAGIRARTYIAGNLQNDPSTMERWIQNPHAINPQTVMPDMGIDSHDATDITAYLYSLK